MAGSCKLALIGDEISITYTELHKMHEGSILPLLAYSIYLNGGKEKMEATGKYKTNRLGEHYAKDIYEFLKMEDFEAELYANNGLNNIEAREGFREGATGELITFSSAKEAIEKAYEYNHNNPLKERKSTVASVIKVDDGYNVQIQEIGTHNLLLQLLTALIHDEHSLISDMLRTKGIEAEHLSEDVQNYLFKDILFGLPLILKDLTTISLEGLRHNPSGCLFLFELFRLMDPSNDTYNRIVVALGGLAPSFLELFNTFNSCVTMPKEYLSSMEKRVIEIFRLMLENFKNNFDLSTLLRRSETNKEDISNSDFYNDVIATKKAMLKKWGIKEVEMFIDPPKIEKIITMRKALEQFVMLLEHRMHLLYLQGDIKATKKAKDTLNRIQKQLVKNRSLDGVLLSLEWVFGEMDNLQSTFELNDIYKNNVYSIESLIDFSQKVSSFLNIYDHFYYIIQALNEHSGIMNSIYMTKEEKEDLTHTILDIKGKLDKYAGYLLELKLYNIYNYYLNTIAPKPGEVHTAYIHSLLQSIDTSPTMFDRLYAGVRSSNPLISQISNIIREALKNRNQIIALFQLRINRAHYKLKGGIGATQVDTSFIYDDDGKHIVSDIDWEAYEDAKEKEKKDLKEEGVYGLDLEIAIDLWEEENTEDELVDPKNMRYERVPRRDIYSKNKSPFTSWSKELMDYYKEVKEILGELNTYLGNKDRNVYLAPLIEATVFENFRKGRFDKGIARTKKGLLGKTLKWKISQGYLFGKKVETNPDGTEKDLIRLYYRDPVPASERYDNFSVALMCFAASAINFGMMSNIEDTVLLLKNHFNAIDSSSEQENAITKSRGSKLSIYRRVFRKKSSYSDILDDIIQMLIYGNIRKKRKGDAANVSEFVGYKILNFNSLLGLAGNITGAAANLGVGELQMLIESGAGEFLNIGDLLWAQAHIIGENAELLFWAMSNNNRTKAGLLALLFDPLNDIYTKVLHDRRHESLLGKLQSIDPYVLYGKGEQVLYHTVMFAVLHHTTVYKLTYNPDGTYTRQKISLYDAFKKSDEPINGNYDLQLIHEVDSHGNTLVEVVQEDGLAIDDAFILKIRNNIEYVNQTCHGSMNEESKGIIHRHLIGKAIMAFKLWMVEHYSRRYRGLYYDASLGQWRRGYYNSVFHPQAWRKENSNKFKEEWEELKKAKRFMLWLWYGFADFLGIKKIDNSLAKSNVRRARMEGAIVIILAMLTSILVIPDDDEDDDSLSKKLYLLLLDHIARLYNDEIASVPNIGLYKAVTKTLGNLASGIWNTGSNVMNLFNFDVSTNNKDLKNVGKPKWFISLKKLIPFLKDWENLMDLIEGNTEFTEGFDKRSGGKALFQTDEQKAKKELEQEEAKALRRHLDEVGIDAYKKEKKEKEAQTENNRQIRISKGKIKLSDLNATQKLKAFRDYQNEYPDKDMNDFKLDCNDGNFNFAKYYK